MLVKYCHHGSKELSLEGKRKWPRCILSKIHVVYAKPSNPTSSYKVLPWWGQSQCAYIKKNYSELLLTCHSGLKLTRGQKIGYVPMFCDKLYLLSKQSFISKTLGFMQELKSGEMRVTIVKSAETWTKTELFPRGVFARCSGGGWPYCGNRKQGGSK